MSASSKQRFNFTTDTMAPRAWLKLEGGVTHFFEADPEEMDEELANAFNELVPETEYNVFALYRYEGNSLRDKPSEVVVRSKSDEDFTMYAYKLDEPDNTSQINQRVDDRRDHLPVTVQKMQGQGHGYAHRSNISDEKRDTLGEIEGLEAEILRGHDDGEWELEQETGAWTSKMNPSPIEWYRDAPRGLDLMEAAHETVEEGFELESNDLTEVATYLDNFRDTIDVIVERYDSEPKAWADVENRNYDALAEHVDGVSAEGLERMLEEFPNQMDKYMDIVHR